MDETIPQKRCTKCEHEWPATPEYFQRNKGQKSGLNPSCKVCAKAYKSQPEVQERHREQERERKKRPEVQEHIREYRKRPEVRKKRSIYRSQPRIREQVRNYNRRPDRKERGRIRSLARYYQPDIKEHMQAQHRAYMHRPEIRQRENARQHAAYHRPETHERILAHRRTRYHRPDVHAQVRARQRIYLSRPEIQEKQHEHHRIYYRRLGVREHMNASRRLAYQNNPEVRERRYLERMNRRAHRKSIPGTLTAPQIQQKLRLQHFRCYYCNAKFEKRGNKYIYHVDHTFPVSRPETGARHDVSHTVLACPPCNCKKGNKLPHEFFEGGRLL